MGAGCISPGNGEITGRCEWWPPEALLAPPLEVVKSLFPWKAHVVVALQGQASHVPPLEVAKLLFPRKVHAVAASTVLLSPKVAKLPFPGESCVMLAGAVHQI